MTHSNAYDFVLVGGGLQSGLISLALRHHQPNSRVLMIERGDQIGGNHTWSYHPGDVPDGCQVWLQSLTQYTWPEYDIRLGSFHRRCQLEYASVSSDHFVEIVSRLFNRSEAVARPAKLEPVMASASNDWRQIDNDTLVETAPRAVDQAHDPSWRLLTNTDVISVTDHQVITDAAVTFKARQVIDCRGPNQHEAVFTGCGFQKFRGFEVELHQDWPHKLPLVMDSLNDQSDGFRFLYTLPFTSRRVLVEDTAFSDTPVLPREDSLQVVAAYLNARGIHSFKIRREESGVLPMPYSDELRPESTSPLAGGYAGGWFHAATGYSFPMAVAFAEAVASGPADSAKDRIRSLAERHQWRSRYSRFLNRLLFRLVAPKHRYRIFRRFYRVLSNDAVERFYSHRFTPFDAFRIVVGIPPTLIGLRPGRFIQSLNQRASS